MNYIVTDKHGFLKPGLEMHASQEKGPWYLDGTSQVYHLPYIEKWLKDGWIVEQQQPEFTKDDMIEFAIRYVSTGYNSVYECFSDWQKTKQ